MALLKEATNEMAFAKLGILGFAGSGKTFTAVDIAIGLHDLIKSKKPISFLDTETGVDYVLPKIKAAGLPTPLVAKTRAFTDLLEITKEAQKESDIFIVDSISHFWIDIVESYLRKIGKKRLAFQDWNVIKPTWRQFTDLYLTSRLHCIICGRAAFEWDYFEADDGSMELHKTGTKMRAENEFGFEPSLLIEMERMKGEDGKQIFRRAYIIKDRFDVLDGKIFDNPKFKDFLPHFELLALGGEHHALDVERTSEDMFEADTGKPEWKRQREQVQIALEELDAELTKLFPSSTKEDKQGRISICEYLFGTSSKTKIENFDLSILNAGLKEIRLLRTDKNADLAKILEGEITHDHFEEEVKEGDKKAIVAELDALIAQIDDEAAIEKALKKNGLELGNLSVGTMFQFEKLKEDLNKIPTEQATSSQEELF